MFVFNLLRSIEIIASAIALSASIFIWLVSGWLSTHWLNFEELTPESVAKSFGIMGVVAGLRLLENIYRSSLIGLQRQVFLNIVLIIGATLRSIGVVAVLTWLSPTVEAFFLWQGCVSVFLIVSLASVVYWVLPSPERVATFSITALREVKNFAGGVAGITLLGLALTQIDKILLSKILSLEEFGYYSIASIVAGSLYLLINPINQAFFPKFSELAARQEKVKIKSLYHHGSQLISVLVGSTAVIMICFSKDILILWMNDTTLALQVAPLLALMAFGNLLNSCMQMPYQLQLAHGMVSLPFKMNLLSVICLIPLMIWSSSRYGAVGAAWIWILLNLGYVSIGAHFMFRNLLTTEKWIWYAFDLLCPIAAGFLSAGVLIEVLKKLSLYTSSGNILSNIFVLSISSAIIFLSSFLSASQLRAKVMNISIEAK